MHTLRAHQYPIPLWHRPSVKGADDTSNFDDYGPPGQHMAAEDGHSLSPSEHELFAGF